MSEQPAPRPKNEDRRVVAVKRTGLIDSLVTSQYFVNLPRKSPILTTLRLACLMKIISVKFLLQMGLITKKMSVQNLMYARMYY